MNCRACGSIDDVKSNTAAALKVLSGKGGTDEEIKRAVACRECAGERLAQECRRPWVE